MASTARLGAARGPAERPHALPRGLPFVEVCSDWQLAAISAKKFSNAVNLPPSVGGMPMRLRSRQEAILARHGATLAPFGPQPCIAGTNFQLQRGHQKGPTSYMIGCSHKASLPTPSEDTTASRAGRLLASVMSSCRLREDDFPVAEPACGFRVIVVVASTRISLVGRSGAARPWVTTSPGAFTFLGRRSLCPPTHRACCWWS